MADAGAVVALTSVFVLNGCAGAGIGMTLFGTGAGVAASTGVSHTLNGIAYKTFTTPVQDLESSTVQALDNMGIAVERAEDMETGRKIVARAEARTIEIELERLSSQATRMRVTAIQGIPLLRDSATATEIILQTAQVVDEWRERVLARKLAAEKALAAKAVKRKAAKK
jgi:hypothetical protein